MAIKIKNDTLKNQYSNKLCIDFPNCVFLEEFKGSIDNFFLKTYYISSAQKDAINKRISPNIIENFTFQTNDISQKSLDILYAYLYESLKNIIKYFKYHKPIFQDIDFASGETHNGKKSILLVSINDTKLVYRPYNMQQLKVLTNIVAHITNLKYKLNIFPKILYASHDYSIIEYIVVQKITDYNKFYYSLGVVLAFSYCMRIVDLFNDNVLFSNNELIIVDTEACFFRDINENKLSLLHLGLVGHKLYSGLVDGTKRDFLIHLDTNNEVSFLIHKNIGKEFLEVNKHSTLIIDGFLDCFTKISNNKIQIIEEIMHKNATIRHIVRPTKAYVNWLIFLFSPCIDIENNLKKLYIEMNDYQLYDIKKEYSEAIVKKELSDLLLTDVPYFYCDFQSRSLYHNGEVVVENFHKRDFYDFFTEHISNINETQLPALLKELEQLIDEHETYNKT